MATFGQEVLGQPVLATNELGAGGNVALTNYLKNEPNSSNLIFGGEGAFSIAPNTPGSEALFDVGLTLIFAVVAYLLTKLECSVVPILLGLVLGRMTEENFRRALIISDGSWSIFASSPVCIAFLVLIAVTLFIVIRGKITESKSGGHHV